MQHKHTKRETSAKVIKGSLAGEKKACCCFKIKKKKNGRKKRFSEAVAINDNAIKIILLPANRAMRVLLQGWNNLFQ